jgi:hypothetical protein
MHITDEQLLKWATRFELPGGISIVRSNLSWQEGHWWIRNADGSRLLTREGWRLPRDIHDGSLLFTTAREAAEFLFAFDLSDPDLPMESSV